MLYSFLPERSYRKLLRYERYGMIALMALIVITNRMPVDPLSYAAGEFTSCCSTSRSLGWILRGHCYERGSNFPAGGRRPRARLACGFRGPLSLILQLLSKNKIEIRDISVAEILEQYLAYLDEMQRMDLEVASEFVQMAAYAAVYQNPHPPGRGEGSHRELEQLMSSLEQLKAKGAREQVRAILPGFGEMSESGKDLFTRRQEPLSREAKAYDYRHDPAELLGALCEAYMRPEVKPPPRGSLRRAWRRSA